MKHLIVSREFPPAAYPAGGIGTYLAHLTQLLAESGETVHVIGERSANAPLAHDVRCGGRLVVHRVRLDDPLSLASDPRPPDDLARELRLLGDSAFPPQRFAWQAARLAESLVVSEGIDVIEGQEWEAPLYYLLLRRALGLGPSAGPPCLVHLHAPTEVLFTHNEWSRARPEYLPMTRMEEYCIGAADGLLCASQYLARQAASRYELEPGLMTIIPYPIGSDPVTPRAASAWREFRFVYVGRLELRKGVIELTDAAIDVARSHTGAQFDFIGDDTSYDGSQTVRQLLAGRVPREFRHRLHFHGQQPRERLSNWLATARAAVVPSRWDNFPNTCAEAMYAGLPVVGSPNGGMAEMIDDGVSGWVAASHSSADLASALRRALAATPDECAAMGRAARDRILQLCDNARVVHEHVAVRAALARAGPRRSLMPPPARFAPEVQAMADLLSGLAREPARGSHLGGLAGSRSPFAAELTLRDVLRLPPRAQVRLAAAALGDPRRALAWLRTRWRRIRAAHLTRR